MKTTIHRYWRDNANPFPGRLIGTEIINVAPPKTAPISLDAYLAALESPDKSPALSDNGAGARKIREADEMIANMRRRLRAQTQLVRRRAPELFPLLRLITAHGASRERILGAKPSRRELMRYRRRLKRLLGIIESNRADGGPMPRQRRSRG